MQLTLSTYAVPAFVHIPGIPSMAQIDGRYIGVILATAVGAAGGGGSVAFGGFGGEAA
jgi:hypothetical protein